MSASKAAWRRLGQLLEQRRVELDTRYQNRAAFASERGIDYRLSYDIESGARSNYRRPTLAAVEVSYAWAPGSIQGVLNGADPVPLPVPGRDGAEEWSALTAEERQIVRDFIETMRRSRAAQEALRESNGA